MTIREFLKKELFCRGLFEDQCDAILEEAMQDDVFKDSMEGRIDHKLEDYPEGMKVILWLNIKRVALDYIERTQSNAWFKGLFL